MSHVHTKRLAAFCSTDPHRYALTHAYRDEHHVVATDGHRLYAVRPSRIASEELLLEMDRVPVGARLDRTALKAGQLAGRYDELGAFPEWRRVVPKATTDRRVVKLRVPRWMSLARRAASAPVSVSLFEGEDGLTLGLGGMAAAVSVQFSMTLLAPFVGQDLVVSVGGSREPLVIAENAASALDALADSTEWFAVVMPLVITDPPLVTALSATEARR
jgi:hypothetical protein